MSEPAFTLGMLVTTVLYWSSVGFVMLRSEGGSAHVRYTVQKHTTEIGKEENKDRTADKQVYDGDCPRDGRNVGRSASGQIKKAPEG